MFFEFFQKEMNMLVPTKNFYETGLGPASTSSLKIFTVCLLTRRLDSNHPLTSRVLVLIKTFWKPKRKGHVMSIRPHVKSVIQH